MKAIKLFATGLVMFFACTTMAQVSVNIHLPSPPLWGPVGHPDVRFYYLPDVEAYYDVQTSMFIYYGGGVWVHRAHLPGRYSNYDLYGGYKVVMPEYRDEAPYHHFKEHRMKYFKGYRGEEQRTIGERPGRGNHDDRNSQEHNQGRRDIGHGDNNGDKHGNDKGNSRGNGRDNKEDHGKGEEHGKRK